MKYILLFAALSFWQVTNAQLPTSKQKPVNEKSCNCSKKQLDFFDGYASAPIVLAGTVRHIDTVFIEVNSLSGQYLYQRIKALVEVTQYYKGHFTMDSITLLNKVEASGMQLKEGKQYVLFAAISSLAPLDSQYSKYIETSKEMGSCLSNAAKLRVMDRIDYGSKTKGSVKACFYHFDGRVTYIYSKASDSIYFYKRWPHDTLIEKMAVFGGGNFSTVWSHYIDSNRTQYGLFKPLEPEHADDSSFEVVKAGFWYYHDLQSGVWTVQSHGAHDTSSPNNMDRRRFNIRSIFKPRQIHSRSKRLGF